MSNSKYYSNRRTNRWGIAIYFISLPSLSPSLPFIYFSFLSTSVSSFLHLTRSCYDPQDTLVANCWVPAISCFNLSLLSSWSCRHVLVLPYSLVLFCAVYNLNLKFLQRGLSSNFDLHISTLQMIVKITQLNIILNFTYTFVVYILYSWNPLYNLNNLYLFIFLYFTGLWTSWSIYNRTSLRKHTYL